jgi:hypothetical protein
VPLLIRGPESQPAPSEYELTAGEAFVPESVTASFDGSGAAGSFLPCLSIYAQSGELLSRTFPDEVAAGDTAEVTFAPLLRAAQAAAAAGTGYPFAVSGINGFYNVPSGVPTIIGIDALSMTSDPGIFSEQASSVPGVTGLGITGDGTYRLDWTVIFQDTVVAPVAAPETFVCTATDGSSSLTVILPSFGIPYARGVANISGRSEWDVDVTDVSVLHGATAAGDPVVITARQTTGVTLHVYTELIAYQLSTDTFGF